LNEIIRQTHRLRRALRAVQVRVDDDRVHELRVRLKRLHWYARVLRPFVPDDRRPLLRRRVSAPLFHFGGHVRDAAIMAELVTATARHTTVDVNALCACLNQEQQQAIEHLHGTLATYDDAMLLELITLVEELAMSTPRDALRARLTAMMQRRLARARRLLSGIRDAEQAHELRKCLKELTYGLDMDATCIGRGGRERRARLHEAEEVLGMMHDMDVLRERLPELARTAALSAQDRKRLDAAVRNERRLLRRAVRIMLEDPLLT
jgi:CHAD domain-containing protein